MQTVMLRTVRVIAPSRLHFGLFGLAQKAGRMYGGVGVMIDRPVVELEIRPATGWSCGGILADRAAAFASRWAAFHDIRPLPECHLEVLRAPPNHVGLGVGTQLALSVAAGLDAFLHLPSSAPQELALSVGRGERSAIGTYGFVMGGLIVERGKLPGEPISPLDCRIDLPDDWRFVLLRPVGWHGLSGELEEDAMTGLPDVSQEITETLIAEARDHLIPAAATANFAEFAGSLYRYGNLAGSCFAARQGGPYNGTELTALIQWLRDRGYAGVGQSSWGPTLFATLPDQSSAEELAARLRQDLSQVALEISISRPDNRGAQVSLISART